MIKRMLRAILYRLRGEYTTEKLIHLGMKVGKNYHRLNGVILDPAHCWLIEIGDNVTMAPRVHVLAHDASTIHYLGYAKIGRVVIGNNVFIGADSIILPNVHIGDNVVIGANSTVSQDLEGGFVYAGSPARKLCSIGSFIEKNKKKMEEVPCYGEEYTTRGKIGIEKRNQMNYELKDSIGYVR